MENLEKLKRILHGSKQFTFNGCKLILMGYYTGEEVILDLSKIDETMLSILISDSADEDDEDEWR